MFQKTCLLFVTLICLNYGQTVEITCDFNADDECVFNDNVNLDGNIEIGNSETVKETTTKIVLKAPLKTNVIPKVIFETFPKMETLMINGVGLTTISSDDFVNAKALMHLQIENNNIGTLKANSFSTLTHLKDLVLSENEITKIEDDAFDGLKELTLLNLYSNKVADLDITTFAKCPKLNHLIMGHMDYKLPALDSDVMEKIVALNSPMKIVDFSNNPIDTPDLWRRLSIFPNLETIYFTATKITHIDHMDELKKLLPHIKNIVMDENPLDAKWLEEANAYFSKEHISFKDT